MANKPAPPPQIDPSPIYPPPMVDNPQNEDNLLDTDISNSGVSDKKLSDTGVSDSYKGGFGDDNNIVSSDVMEAIADATENKRPGNTELNTEYVYHPDMSNSSV